MSNFEQQLNINLKTITENDLFNILKKYVWKDLEHTPNKFDSCDTTFSNKTGGCELKCRRKHYNTLRIEKEKYDHLMNNYQRKYYCCSTPLNIFCFNLDKIKPVWETTLNPLSTEFENKEMVWKETYDIQITKENIITELILSRFNQ